MNVVYKITNIENDKVYVGYSSRGATNRWYQHCANAFKKSKKSRLYSAMRKYGSESFVVKTIYEGKDALQKENDFIIEYNSKNEDYGYNMTDGGEANRLGIPNSEEQKAKISASLKGSKKSPETIAAMKAAWVKRKLNGEAKKGTKWGTPFQKQPDNKVSAQALYMRKYRMKNK